MRFEKNGCKRHREERCEIVRLGQFDEVRVFAPSAVEWIVTRCALRHEPELSQTRAQFQQLFRSFDEKGLGGEVIFACDMRGADASRKISGQFFEASGPVRVDSLANARGFIGRKRGLRRRRWRHKAGSSHRTGGHFQKGATVHKRG